MKKRTFKFVKIFAKIVFVLFLTFIFYMFLHYYIFEPEINIEKLNTEFDLSVYYTFSGGNSNEGRRDFLYQFGISTGRLPKKRIRVHIPEEFDNELEELNVLQERIGCNLKNYTGCYLRRYTYNVTNLEGEYTANVFVHRDSVAGAYIEDKKSKERFAVYERN